MANFSALLLASFLISGAALAQEGRRLPVLEPASIDLSKPLTEAACVETTSERPSATAWEKLVVIMNARKQLIAVEGDKIVIGPAHRHMMFTISNNFSGREGYIISSSTNKADKRNSEGFCFTPVSRSVFVDVERLEAVPPVLGKGELGIALANNHKLGSKVAVMGMHSQGSLFVVHFNPATGRGAYKESDAQGNGFRDLAIYTSIDYSEKMKAVMRELKQPK